MAFEDDPLAPARSGDWVESRYSDGKVGKIRSIYWSSGEWLIDLVIYSHRGDRVGRESPPMGGPRTFEPALPYNEWVRITAPVFPITLKWVPSDTGSHVAKYVSGGKPRPDGAYRPRRSRSGVAAKLLVERNFDPDRESYARTIAAQELREQARLAGGNDRLTERAKELEAEAASLRNPI
jgi:hypothetical protein